jgi:hypothetical protein
MPRWSSGANWQSSGARVLAGGTEPAVRFATLAAEHVQGCSLGMRGGYPGKAMLVPREGRVPVVAVRLDAKGLGKVRSEPACRAAGMKKGLRSGREGQVGLRPLVSAELLRPLPGTEHGPVHAPVGDEVQLRQRLRLERGHLLLELTFAVDSGQPHVAVR